MRYVHPVLLLHHENKALLALPDHRQHRNHRHGFRAPDNFGLHDLGIAQRLRPRPHRGFHQNPLQRAVHFRRDEIDLRLFQQLAVVVGQVDAESHVHLGGALRGNVDVRLKLVVLVHRGQHGRRRGRR